MSVGDVNSEERGSGARYNDGKPPMQYIPFRQQLIVYLCLTERQDVLELLKKLDLFERGAIEMWDIVQTLSIKDLHEAAYVWEYGANKYSAWNWAKGMPWSVPLACISRHAQAIIKGQELDGESGCSHWGHIICNILMLEHYGRFYREGDDRPDSTLFIDKSGLESATKAA